MSEVTNYHTRIRLLSSQLLLPDASIRGSLSGQVLQLIRGMAVAMTSMISHFIAGGRMSLSERRPGVGYGKSLCMGASALVGECGFYKEYAVLFNWFRSGRGRQCLVFEAELNRIAAQRAIEISQPGNFSHAGALKHKVAENIAMMAYSSDSPGDLLQSWATSPGHRSNMLSYTYHRTGFAKNGRYAVQVFGLG